MERCLTSKQRERIVENEQVMDVFNRVMEKVVYTGFYGSVRFYPKSRTNYSKRLYNCSAEILYTDNGIFLQSYDTVIAYYDGNTVYDFLRYVYGYTTTSAQHIRKFMKYVGCSNLLRYYPM